MTIAGKDYTNQHRRPWQVYGCCRKSAKGAQPPEDKIWTMRPMDKITYNSYIDFITHSLLFVLAVLFLVVLILL